ncbi:MAG: hypothetical protein AUG48_07090 [Actinobacteria bacterium 13_1_20CM_3_68_9]|nr:MAG: hypothetical protein AUG48_07090 [Actinobacteria bacterium 13_1_20CM_3_68_9]
MSIPGWQASHGRGSQNGDVIGPLTGQMNPDVSLDLALDGAEIALEPLLRALDLGEGVLVLLAR